MDFDVRRSWDQTPDLSLERQWDHWWTTFKLNFLSYKMRLIITDFQGYCKSEIDLTPWYVKNPLLWGQSSLRDYALKSVRSSRFHSQIFHFLHDLCLATSLTFLSYTFPLRTGDSEGIPFHSLIVSFMKIPIHLVKMDILQDPVLKIYFILLISGCITLY